MRLNLDLNRLKFDLKRLKFDLSLKTILIAVAVVAVSFFVSLKAMDLLTPRASRTMSPGCAAWSTSSCC